jgi:hypothetical protein
MFAITQPLSHVLQRRALLQEESGVSVVEFVEDDSLQTGRQDRMRNRRLFRLSGSMAAPSASQKGLSNSRALNGGVAS